MAIAVSMMKVNERVMSQTDNLGSMDFDNPALRELVERQMSSMSAMRSLCRWKARTLPESRSAAGRSR